MNHQIIKGCTSVSVLKIQQCLNQLYPQLNLIEDGMFLESTEQALKYFQQQTGLPPTGCLTSQTWDKIILKTKTKRQPEPCTCFPIKPLCYGCSGMDVKKAQEYLNLILPEERFEPDGIFDARTQVKVIRFQNKAGLNPDGRINLATWDKIIEYM